MKAIGKSARLRRAVCSIVILTSALWALSACATLGLTGPQSEALCADAQRGIAMARVALPLVTSDAERLYWERWLAAAEATAAIACASQGEAGLAQQ